MRRWKGPVEYCAISFGATTSIHINDLPQSDEANHKALFVFDSDYTPVSNDYACYQLHGLSYVEELVPGNLPENIREFLKLYAPYCFLFTHARRWQRAVAVSHSAQSLDGRIATTSGDSKWIGNEANLLHAHRMRALCDGVLIGSRTLKRDQPRLTVRRVSGPNPVRIVLGSSVDNVDSLLEASEDLILILGNNQLRQNHQVRKVAVDKENDHIATLDILERLYRERIYSVYIEGGAVTTSHFLKENTIDILQLHIAPMILGSGMNAFSLPPIEAVGESIPFVRHTLMPQGDTIMFVGEVDNSHRVVANA